MKVVTVEQWKDPEFRKTLNIIDLFEVRDKTQPDDNADTRKVLLESPV